MISSTGTPPLTSVLASVSAKIPHLELILCSDCPLYGIFAKASGEICNLRAVFSMNVPVPPLQADCI